MNIEQRLLEIVKSEFNKKNVENLHLDLTFRQDLGLDSLSLTELVLACEETFNIEIDVDHPATARARTLKELYSAIVSLVDPSESNK